MFDSSKILLPVMTLVFLFVCAGAASAQGRRTFPVLENEKLKELYVELATIDAAMGFEKVSYPDLAVSGAEAVGIRIVSMESALERHPGVFGNKDGCRVSRNEFGLDVKIDFGENKSREYSKNFSTWGMSSESWVGTGGFSWREPGEKYGQAYAFPVMWSAPSDSTDDFVCVQTYSHGQPFSAGIKVFKSDVFERYLASAREWLEPEGVDTAALLARLDSGLPAEKEFAIRLLGKKRDKICITAIAPYLSGQDLALRGAAFAALGMIGGNEAIEALVPLMEMEDKQFNYRLQVIDALGRMGSADALPALKAQLANDNAYVRAQAVEALGETGAGDEAVRILLPYFSDKDNGVRYAVVDALHKLGWRAE